MKTLVVFYSLNGSTKFIADLISEKTGADQLRLKPLQDIKKKGLMRIFWGGKQVITKKKPKLEPFDKNPENYDVIFVGTPVWVGTFAPALRAFFEKAEFKGKTVIPFCSYGGNPKNTLEEIKQNLPDNEYLEGFSFKEAVKDQESARQQVIGWLEEIRKKLAF
jgi:flavodoxin